MTTIRIIPDPHRPTHRRRVILRDDRALVVHEHLQDHHGRPLWALVRVDPSVPVGRYEVAA